jgi:outer membrane receptor protein involved in Fe transport
MNSQPTLPADRPSTFRSLRSVGIILLAGLAGLVRGQAVKPAAPLVVDEDMVMLSPFEVRTDGDVGYTAASALAGGRTDTPLKQTPAAISVMTSQFLEDIGATNFRSAAEWSLNWVPQPETNTGGFGGFAVNYRNMGSSFASRNYFLWYVESDAYNTERYEFARGPNGVLFGDAGAGGISTTWTKRPRFDRRTYSVNARLESFGGYRTSLDLNRPINDRLALRLNTLFERGTSWRDYSDNNREGAHLAGVVRLTRRNQFRFEGELGHQIRSIYPNYYNDQASFWNGTTTYNGVTAPSTTGTGVARLNASNYFLYLPGTPNNGFNDWGPFYQSTGTGLSLLPTAERRADIPNSAAIPKPEFNFQPPDSVGKLSYYTYSFYVDHRFSDRLFVELAYNRLMNNRYTSGGQSLFNTYRIDVNQVLPGGGGPNPNFGRPFTDAERVISLQENLVDDIRALANWRFETGWLKQSFSFIAGSRLDRFDSWSKTLRRTNGTNPNLTVVANLFRDRIYWNEAGRKLGPVPSIPGVNLDFVPTAISHQRKVLDYTQVASTSRFFSDRLTVMLGARRDGVTNSQQTTAGLPLQANGLPELGAVVIPPGGTVPVGVVGAKALSDVSPVSTNAGAVYFLRPWIGIYANTSETFAAPNNGANYIDGRPPGISQSTGQDFGFKVEFFEGRISGSVSYYTSEQVGLIVASIRETEINRLWTNLGRVDLARVSYRDTQDQTGDGYEVDLAANPTRNLRVTFNLALPETSAVNLRPGLVGYYAEHRAQWQAGASDPANANRAQMQTDLNAIASDLAALAPGTPLNNTYKYTSNLYATYTVPGGPLRNVSLGAGANFRGKSKIASTLASAYDYLYSDSYYLVSAHATWRHRFNKSLNGRFQLNVSNVFNSDKLIYNTYATFRVGGLAANPLNQVPGTIRIPEPRKITLSATFDF